MNADNACDKISGPGGRNDKTATGEMVEGQGRFRVLCQSAWGHLLQTIEEKMSVHKPLLSAGDVTDEGQALWGLWVSLPPGRVCPTHSRQSSRSSNSNSKSNSKSRSKSKSKGWR